MQDINRRLVQDASRSAKLREFQKILTDISLGRDSDDVRALIVDAYVRGYKVSAPSVRPT